MKSPFQEDIVVDNYFATKHTEESLQAIHAAVRDGVPMIVLSGEEGAGKTMLCHKLDQDTEKGYGSVFFPHTVDSFEDVVKIIAFSLNIDSEIDGETRGIEDILSEITESLQESGEPLLLIIDEAENIYLATLERIRKMLDRFNVEDGLLHVLFSGRQGFLENCDQLSMCDFQTTGELHVKLEPLTSEETGEYLDFCGKKIPDFDTGSVFTPEVVADIYKISEGNFRMTNILAEEAVQKNGDDTSFMVLLENVKEDIGESADENGPLTMIRDYIAHYRSYLPYGAAAVVLLVGAVFYLVAGSGNEPGEKRISTGPVQILPAIEKPHVVEADKEESLSAPVSIGVEEGEEEGGPEIAPTPDKDIEFAGGDSEAASEVIAVPVAQSEKQEPQAQEIPQIEAVAQEPQPAAEVSETEQATVGKIEVKKQAEKKVKIVELYRDQNLKKKPGKLPKTTLQTIRSVPEIEKPASKRNVVQDVIASNAHFTADQLYKKRVMAGSSWYNNERDDKYTVQLMVLKSSTAEENFKEMLREDRYRQEAGNFYIFRKLATSSTLFIFYGEYATISQARLAQNSLPQFLRDHKPYAISVKGAMAKVRRQ